MVKRRRNNNAFVSVLGAYFAQFLILIFKYFNHTIILVQHSRARCSLYIIYQSLVPNYTLKQLITIIHSNFLLHHSHKFL